MNSFESEAQNASSDTRGESHPADSTAGERPGERHSIREINESIGEKIRARDPLGRQKLPPYRLVGRLPATKWKQTAVDEQRDVGGE